MARTDGGKGLDATLGRTAANVGGTHGGINPRGGGSIPTPDAHGSTGNPGTEFPWEGADSTAIGANTQLPPLTHLGSDGPGHEGA